MMSTLSRCLLLSLVVGSLTQKDRFIYTHPESKETKRFPGAGHWVQDAPVSQNGWTPSELAFISQVNSTEPDIDGRYSYTFNHPYLVQVNIDNEQQCTGSLIESLWVVTTASCLHDSVTNATVSPSNLTLRAAATFRNFGGSLYNVTSIVVHPSYGHDSLRYNIALLQVNPPIKYNRKMQPVEWREPEELQDGSDIRASGWGYNTKGNGVRSNILQQSQVTLVTETDCAQSYPSESRHVTDQTICVQQPTESSTWQHDLGSALTRHANLIGMFSFGNDQAGSPDVYTRISAFRNFIAETINETLD